MVTSLVELKAALAAADFDRFLGTPEDTWIDFKKEPYRLDTFKGRWEYAKDVAALANANGGCLVIGVKTGRPQNELVSVAESYALVPKNLVDQKQHGDALINAVYPEVWGVTFSWCPPDGGSAAGLLLIEVPPQRQRDKPFVMRTMIGPEGRQMNALGVPVRNGSETTWLKAERIHPLLSGVLGTSSTESAESLERRFERANHIAKTIFREGGWTELPTLVLQALPPPPLGVVPGLHGRDGVRGWIEDPRNHGQHSWDLRVSAPFIARDGGLFRIDDRRAFWLEREGALTAAAVADRDFLGWGMDRGGNDTASCQLNPLALVEYVYEFFRLVYVALARRTSPGEWTFRITATGWKSLAGGVCLTAGPVEAAWYQQKHPASGDAFEDVITGTGVPERDAATVLEHLYGLFGLGVSDIPYVADGAVQIDALKKI